MTKRSEDGYIIETIKIGGSVKVTAFDPESLREVSIVVPPTTTRKEMAQLAIKKLHYMQQHEDKN